MSFFYIITSLTAVAGVIYIWARLLRFLPVPSAFKWGLTALFLIASQNMLILRKLVETPLAHDLIAKIGMVMGIVQAFEITLIGMCGLCDLALLCFWLGRRMAPPVFRRGVPPDKLWFKSSLRGLHKRAVVLFTLGLIFLGIGVHGALREPIIKEQELSIAGLPAALSGVRMALLADVHIGAGLDGEWLQEVVDATNAQKPDIILIAGDVVDGTVERLYEEVKCLAELQATYGVYLITGNHEYYSGYRDWMRAFKRMQLTVLTNENRVVNINGAELVIAGVTDETSISFSEQPPPDPVAAMIGAPDKAVKILLRHRPGKANEAAALGYDAQLSGHTHGGQIIFLYPLIKMLHGYVLGLYNVDGMPLYVTPGTGVWARFPIRLGTTPEITILTLSEK